MRCRNSNCVFLRKSLTWIGKWRDVYNLIQIKNQSKKNVDALDDVLLKK